MELLRDCEGRSIRFTEERWSHIAQHPEMTGMRSRGRIHLVFDRSREGRKGVMAEKILKMWFDPEGDYLEVTFEKKPGYFRATENDQVMEKVDEMGNVIGFSVLRVSSVKKAPIEAALH